MHHYTCLYWTSGRLCNLSGVCRVHYKSGCQTQAMNNLRCSLKLLLILFKYSSSFNLQSKIKSIIILSLKHLHHYAYIGLISFQNTINRWVGDNESGLNFVRAIVQIVIDFREFCKVNRKNFAEPRGRAL